MTDNSRIEAIRDLLDHPRHDIDAKGRRWLKGELRDELRAPLNAGDSSRDEQNPLAQDQGQ